MFTKFAQNFTKFRNSNQAVIYRQLSLIFRHYLISLKYQYFEKIWYFGDILYLYIARIPYFRPRVSTGRSRIVEGRRDTRKAQADQRGGKNAGPNASRKSDAVPSLECLLFLGANAKNDSEAAIRLGWGSNPKSVTTIFRNGVEM